jgi:hypothetical protein
MFNSVFQPARGKASIGDANRKTRSEGEALLGFTAFLDAYESESLS